jgi:hypothetical protein
MEPVTSLPMLGEKLTCFVFPKFSDWFERAGLVTLISCPYNLVKMSLSYLIDIKNFKFVWLYIHITWSLTLREEHRLRVFGNRVLRRIFGPKRDEVTGEWRKFHNEELCDLYSSPSIIRLIKSRSMRWAGHVARMERRGTRIDY